MPSTYVCIHFMSLADFTTSAGPTFLLEDIFLCCAWKTPQKLIFWDFNDDDLNDYGSASWTLLKIPKQCQDYQLLLCSRDGLYFMQFYVKMLEIFKILNFRNFCKFKVNNLYTKDTPQSQRVSTHNNLDSNAQLSAQRTMKWFFTTKKHTYRQTQTRHCGN